jgi:sirohydrochlorin ferrochelatase
VANGAVADLAQLWSSVGRGSVRGVFATTAPRASDALDEDWTTPPIVVSLFLAPGLLLDRVSRRAADLGVWVTAPLGPSLAQLVLQRYDDAVRQS